MMQITKIPPLQCPLCASTSCTMQNIAVWKQDFQRWIDCDDCRLQTNVSTGDTKKLALPQREPRPEYSGRGLKRHKKKQGFADHQLAVDLFVKED